MVFAHYNDQQAPGSHTTHLSPDPLFLLRLQILILYIRVPRPVAHTISPQDGQQFGYSHVPEVMHQRPGDQTLIICALVSQTLTRVQNGVLNHKEPGKGEEVMYVGVARKGRSKRVASYRSPVKWLSHKRDTCAVGLPHNVEEVLLVIIYLTVLIGKRHTLLRRTLGKVNCQIRTSWLYWNGGVQSGRRLEVGV